MADELFIASRDGNVDEVERLLAEGADVNIPEWEAGRTALIIASLNGHVDVVERLLAVESVKVNIAGVDRRTALMSAR